MNGPAVLRFRRTQHLIHSGSDLAMAARVWVWLAVSIAGLFGCGLLALFTAAYLSSATGIGAQQREVVLASQTALWWLAMVGVVAIAGRALGLATPTLRAAALPSAVAAFAVLLAFWVASESRAGGAIDIDRVGPVVFAPALLVSVAATMYARGIAKASSRSRWSVALAALTLALAVWVPVLLLTDGLPGPASSSLVMLALTLVLGLAWWTLLRPGRADAPA